MRRGAPHQEGLWYLYSDAQVRARDATLMGARQARHRGVSVGCDALVG